MRFGLLIYCLFMGKLFAVNLKINIEPERPQVNSPYNIIFRIMTKGDEEPTITFDPEGAKMLEQQSRGMSMRTKFINGKLFTEKEATYSYEFISGKTGTAFLRNIKIKIGNKHFSHPDFPIRIAREIPKARDFFVEARVSKKDVFVGEGITVKYYLYSKGVIRNFELKSYPKLKKFLKRFIDRPERAQRVEIAGEIFRRELLYAARVFAESPGKYRVDPIKIRVEYSKINRNNPFGMNLSLRRLRTQNIQSKVVKINVKPLPPAPQDIEFSGLVGKHSFKLLPGKKRYLVNEAIELKLEITGEGALEAYDGPSLYAHADLEEFETNSDLRILDYSRVNKIYEYTYLARNSFEIKDRMLRLVYFNPENLQYEREEIAIPGIKIIGGVVQSTTQPAEDKQGDPLEELERPSSAIVGPLFRENIFNQAIILRYLNIFLAVIACLIILSFFLVRREKNLNLKRAQEIVKLFKHGEASYSDIFQLFNLVRGESKDTLKDFIEKKGFSSATQEYLLKLIEIAEDQSYLEGEMKFKFQYDKRSFRELLCCISR